MSTMQTTENGSVIRDLSLWERGRMELSMAENEMPGLVALRQEYGSSKPLTGAKISGSLHMTIQTAVLIETLAALGAEVRWCSCNIFSTQDEAAAAIVKANTATVFAWKGETLEEYWECTLKMLDWGQNAGPDLIVDDGADATWAIHVGYEHELAYVKNGNSFAGDSLSAFKGEELIAMTLIEAKIRENPTFFSQLVASVKGVSEETTTGIHRLLALQKENRLKFPVINVNDCVTKSKFDNIYGCRHSLTDGIMRATDILIGGKRAIVCGYGDVGKGCAQALKGAGARVFVSEVDPICALQAAMDGYTVNTVESVVGDMDFFITATGNKDIITLEHMQAMKHLAVVCNIGHFDNEIQTTRLFDHDGIVRTSPKAQVDVFTFPESKKAIILLAEGRLVNLGCATGHPSFVMSCSFSNQLLAQIHLWQMSKRDVPTTPTVTLLDKALDEKVAELHLAHLGAQLTKLTPQQAEYIGVPQSGPFKRDTYRY